MSDYDYVAAELARREFERRQREEALRRQNDMSFGRRTDTTGLPTFHGNSTNPAPMAGAPVAGRGGFAAPPPDAPPEPVPLAPPRQRPEQMREELRRASVAVIGPQINPANYTRRIKRLKSGTEVITWRHRDRPNAPIASATESQLEALHRGNASQMSPVIARYQGVPPAKRRASDTVHWVPSPSDSEGFRIPEGLAGTAAESTRQLLARTPADSIQLAPSSYTPHMLPGMEAYSSEPRSLEHYEAQELKMREIYRRMDEVDARMMPHAQAARVADAVTTVRQRVLQDLMDLRDRFMQTSRLVTGKARQIAYAAYNELEAQITNPYVSTIGLNELMSKYFPIYLLVDAAIPMKRLGKYRKWRMVNGRLVAGLVSDREKQRRGRYNRYDSKDSRIAKAPRRMGKRRKYRSLGAR